MQQHLYIQVRKSQINFYREVPLYYQASSDAYMLYKPAGTSLPQLRINQKRYPRLFIREDDRIAAIQELQKGFNKKIEQCILSGDVAGVKASLCNLVEETLDEPRSGTLKALPETIDTLVSGYSDQPEILRSLASISFKDYTTVIHSVNVMALTLAFCLFVNFELRKTRRIGLSALLHDIGKTEIPASILTAPRKLTDKEFKIMKTHPAIGGEIIQEVNKLSADVARGALEHHEKLDGSGYPNGARNISYVGQLLGIIDCYEALTNEDRPYRRAKQPLETLKFIKEDVRDGKFNRDIYEKFCYSLT